MKRHATYMYRLGRKVADAYGRTSASQFAAAISYRALFSLVPLITFVATVIGAVLAGDDSLRAELVDAISERLRLTETGAADLDGLIAAVPSPWSLTGLIALAIALWGATGVMSSVRKALAVVFDDGEPRSFARGKLVDALLVIGVLVLMLLALGLSVLHKVASRLGSEVEDALAWEVGNGGFIFGVVVPLVLTTGVFALLIRLLPRRRPEWRPALIGAAAGGLGFQAIQAGLAWYVGRQGDFTSIFASAGSVFVFLLSVYLGANAFLVGAILTSVLDDRGEGESRRLARQ